MSNPRGAAVRPDAIGHFSSTVPHCVGRDLNVFAKRGTGPSAGRGGVDFDREFAAGSRYVPPHLRQAITAARRAVSETGNQGPRFVQTASRIRRTVNGFRRPHTRHTERVPGSSRIRLMWIREALNRVTPEPIVPALRGVRHDRPPAAVFRRARVERALVHIAERIGRERRSCPVPAEVGFLVSIMQQSHDMAHLVGKELRTRKQAVAGGKAICRRIRLVHLQELGDPPSARLVDNQVDDIRRVGVPQFMGLFQQAVPRLHHVLKVRRLIRYSGAASIRRLFIVDQYCGNQVEAQFDTSGLVRVVCPRHCQVDA